MAELDATMDVHEFALWRALAAVEAEEASAEEAPALATPEMEPDDSDQPLAERVAGFMRHNRLGGDG